jgi:hypothetical protein
VYLQHLSSLQFLTDVAFFAVVVAAIAKFVPGKAPPVRTTPYAPAELAAHDPKTAKYFVAAGIFLVLGSVHMLVKNLPWVEEYLARTGYAGHLVRDLSNTHLMIVGGGTLLATGLCWFVLPRVVGRPLASEGLAQCAFWFTVAGLAIFYVSLIGNGIAIGRLMEQGWPYDLAKLHMGKWYKVPTGIGAGVMGLGYWCFATNVFVTIFQARLVRVPKPHVHLGKYFATGAAALTLGTVQGVIQVQPKNADWLYTAGHAGEWIDPISHAHINLVTGLTMLVAGALFALVRAAGGIEPDRRVVDACFYALLGWSLTFYTVALYLGFHEGHLVVRNGLTPEQAEEATRLHPYLIMVAGIGMFVAFWVLLGVMAHSFRRTRAQVRWFVFAGCAALALGTLQGPVQAFPAVNELLDRGGDAGDVIVNLHAQLNMLGGLMVILVGLTLVALNQLGAAWPKRRARMFLAAVPGGMLAYYLLGIAFAAVEAHAVANGSTFASSVRELEPWQAALAVPAALVVLIGFTAFARAAWEMSTRQRAEARRAIAQAPEKFTGRIPNRVRRRSPAALAGYELPMALLGFPGLGWLFAGFPLTASFLLLGGPALTWAIIPAAFSPYGAGPLREIGWQVELAWLPTMALGSSALLYRAHLRRRRRWEGRPPRAGHRRRLAFGTYRARVGISLGVIALVLACLPFLPAVAGVGGSTVRYSYEPRFTRELTGQFLQTGKGPVKLFAWSDPQASFPEDSLRVRPRDVRSLLVRAAAVDDPTRYQLYDLDHGGSVTLRVRARTKTTLTLVPTRSLRPGHYAFVASHEGMFGGRDFDYLTVVQPGGRPTAISSGDSRTAPAVFDALLPLAAAVLALLFAVRLATSAIRRPAGQKVLWAIGFALFAAAAAAEALAHRDGWSPGLFRAYYAAGGVLTVAYLGAGSAWLLLPRRARDVMIGALALATVAAVTTVLLAPVDGRILAEATAGRPPANGAIAGHAFVWAIALNSFGTLFLVGGSLYSIARRQRVRVNLWIGGGALVVALATGMSRAGAYDFVYAGELVGIASMFAGFTFVGRPAVPRSRPAHVEPKPVAAGS